MMKISLRRHGDTRKAGDLLIGRSGDWTENRGLEVSSFSGRVCCSFYRSSFQGKGKRVQ